MERFGVPDLYVMTVLVNIAIIAVVAFCSATLSKFLDFCMEDGNILDWYYKLIIKIGKVETDKSGNILSSNRLFKPLGGCLLCFNFWVSVPGYVWVCTLLDYNAPVMILLFWFYESLSGYFVQFVKRMYNE